MRTKLRQQLLASTLLVGAVSYGNPAFAQSTDQTTTGPVEAQPTPTISQSAPAAQQSEIIITGSRIPQPNLESAAPVTVVSDQDVKLTGSTRIEDTLNQLPSVGASQASGVSNGASGTAEVDLRYLGSKRTLSLVNGRRLTPGDPNSTTQAADLNIIPAALIKRVEVLTGGASSVYGADAVAGVVNFILDTNFTGIRFDGTASIYQHNQHDPFVGTCLNAQGSAGCTEAGQNVHISDLLNGRGFPVPTGSDWGGRAFDGTVSIGSAFDDGRGHAVAYFGYRNVKPILQSDRDFSACTIQESITQHGSGPTKFFTPRNPRCGGSITAAPGNILAFPSPSLTTSTTIALGPGTAELGQNLFNFAPYNYFQRPDERYIAGAFADYEISPAIKPYLEFMFMDDRTLAQIAPGGDFANTTSLNCNNPLFSADVAALVCGDANQDGIPDSLSYPNLVGGFIGNFPVAIGAPYNTVANGVGGTTALGFIDPTTGATYYKGFGLLARRNVEGGPRIADLKHQSWRGVLGSKGDLSNAWSYDASFQYGRVDYEQVYKNEFSLARLTKALDVVPVLNGTVVPVGTPGAVPTCRSVVTQEDPTCVPYDVFGVNGPSQAAINYLNTTGVIVGQTSEQIANANFTGSLGEYGIKFPWAQDGVGVNLGAEYRRESLEVNPDASFIAGDLTGQGAPTLPVSGNFRVYELFGETQIPIVQDNFIKELSVGLGYRKSWYKTHNNLVAGQDRKYSTDTYKISVEFAPIQDIRFRGSYNRAVRAPNIQELFAPQFVGLDGSKDPCAGHAIQPDEFGCRFIANGVPGPLNGGGGTPGNPAGQYNGLLGGNPNLNPEKATTKTVGVILQPRFIPRFALTVDYWNIKVADAIQGIGADAILTACVNQSTSETNISPACALVHRNAAGSIWLTPDGFVSDLPGNTSTIKTDGWDVNTSYSTRLFNLGTLSASFLGTYLHKYKVNNGLTEEYDCAGLYGPICSGSTVASSAPMPKWRHKARVGLQMPFGLGLSVQWRYVGKVKAETLESNETLHGATNVDPGLHIKAQNYIDLASTFNIGSRYNFRVGVNNVFDNDPPLVQSGSGALEGTNLCPTGPCNGNTYPGTWDALGRYIYAGATITFSPPKAVPPPPPPPPAPPPPPPAAPATITCPDGLVILANQSCPALPPPPPPPPPAPERGH